MYLSLDIPALLMGRGAWNMNTEVENPFAGWDLISTYTRAQAIGDGTLVDVSETAKQAGFKFPVAVTAALWADIETIPASKKGFQNVQGRLWDVLWMGYIAIRRAREDGDTLLYPLVMHVGNATNYRVKLVCGPGDEREGVITLMRPDED